jgi:hypothetical protein
VSSIADQPHYELPSAELAAWVERRGPGQWWVVDGDRYLGSRVPMPCRGDELAAALRRANRPLLVHDPKLRPDAKGQPVTASEIDSLTAKTNPAWFEETGQPVPTWANDRYLWLCWKGDPSEWTLTEDSEATAAFKDVQTEPIEIW